MPLRRAFLNFYKNVIDKIKRFTYNESMKKALYFKATRMIAASEQLFSNFFNCLVKRFTKW